MYFQCSMILLHLIGAGPEVRVQVSLDLLRRLRHNELVDDLNGGPVLAPAGRKGGPDVERRGIRTLDPYLQSSCRRRYRRAALRTVASQCHL